MTNTPDKQPKLNTLKLLNYFISGFVRTYGQPYSVNMGKDLAVMKRVKVAFEDNPQLGDIYTFIDLCLEHNKKNMIGTPYLLKVVNKKLGKVKKSHVKDLPPMDSATVAQWAKIRREEGIVDK